MDPARRRSTYDDEKLWNLPDHHYKESKSIAYPNLKDEFFPTDPYDFSVYHWDENAQILNILDQIIRQSYRHFLFRMPSMYFSRVAKVFYNSRIKVEDLTQLKKAGKLDPNEVTPAIRRFRALWNEFVDTLVEEWKTLNIISTLLLSAVLTIFQIDAANTPIIRTSAFLSLASAFMSLVFGCIYIVRFGTMKNKHKAASFAKVMQRTESSVLWNVLVLLAIPAVWLAWSLLFFCIAILAFVWTDGNASTPSTSDNVLLGSRIAITAVFGFGLVHFLLIVYTFRFETFIPFEFPPANGPIIPGPGSNIPPRPSSVTIDDIHNAHNDWGFDDFNQEFISTGQSNTLASALAREVAIIVQKDASDVGSRRSPPIIPAPVMSPEPIITAPSPPPPPIIPPVHYSDIPIPHRSPPHVVFSPPSPPRPPSPLGPPAIIPVPPSRSPSPPRRTVTVPMIALADPPVIAIPGIPIVSPPTNLQRMDSESSRPGISPIAPQSPGVYRNLSFSLPSRQASGRRRTNSGGNRARGPQSVDASGSGNGSEPRPSPRSRRTESEGSVLYPEPRGQFEEIPYAEERRPARLTRERRS